MIPLVPPLPVVTKFKADNKSVAAETLTFTVLNTSVPLSTNVILSLEAASVIVVTIGAVVEPATAAVTTKLSAPTPPVIVAPLLLTVIVSAAEPPLIVSALTAVPASVIDSLPVAAEPSIEVNAIVVADPTSICATDKSTFCAPVITMDFAALSVIASLLYVFAAPPETILIVSILASANVPTF